MGEAVRNWDISVSPDSEENKIPKKVNKGLKVVPKTEFDSDFSWNALSKGTKSSDEIKEEEEEDSIPPFSPRNKNTLRTHHTKPD